MKKKTKTKFEIIVIRRKPILAIKVLSHFDDRIVGVGTEFEKGISDGFPDDCELELVMRHIARATEAINRKAVKEKFIKIRKIKKKKNRWYPFKRIREHFRVLKSLARIGE